MRRAPVLLSLAIASAGGGVAQAQDNPWALPDEPLLGFVEIAAGPFLMGSDRSMDPLAFDNERWSGSERQGLVEVPTFYVGKYEVTVSQFRAFVEATAYPVNEQALGAPPDHPVAFISWPDALAYARWLQEVLREWPGTPPLIRQLLDAGWRVSLPSEAEWEKAAKGSAGGAFPWGDQPARGIANFDSSGALPVGTFDCSACAYGLSDMAGNVWEWTRSPYQPYPYTDADDRTDLETDALWVMRGGGFADTEQNVRTTVRGGADPGVRRDFLGFRVVLSRF